MTTTSITNINNSIATIAEQIGTVTNSSSLKIALERFDNAKTDAAREAAFSDLLKKVTGSITSAGFTRKAPPDLIAQLSGELSNDMAELGVSGNLNALGSSVAVRTAYRQLSKEGDSIFGANLRPAVMPGTDRNNSIAATFKALGTTPDALAETIAACKDQDAARRVLSQILLGNVLQNLSPDSTLTAAGATKGFSMDGMTAEKYNALRGPAAEAFIAGGYKMSPFLYDKETGHEVNTTMLDALNTEIKGQLEGGTLTAEQATNLKNIVRMIKSINGVQTGPSQEKLQWRALFEQRQQTGTVAA